MHIAQTMAASTCCLSSLHSSKLHLHSIRSAIALSHVGVYSSLNQPLPRCSRRLRSSRAISVKLTNRLGLAFEGDDVRSRFITSSRSSKHFLITTAAAASSSDRGARGRGGGRVDGNGGGVAEYEEGVGEKGPHMHDVHTPDENQRLLVIQPEYKSGHLERPYVPATYKLDEAVSLAEAIMGWEVHSQRVDSIRQVHNRFLFGKGKVKELQSTINELGNAITGVFVNVPVLSPLQHRTLEEMFGVDIFDRFGIVLRIFKERAHTKEAKVQVELAEIPYLKMRLFEQLEEEGGFSHQRGGTGKMGGAGETSVEVMKQKLNKRQKHLREELKELRRKHHLSREQRSKHTGLPMVAIVGYTNAGKTTLIKALTHDQSMQPEDMLFATLDSTVHAGKLPCGLKVLFVDTIGFVSDLPHELIESFQTTLEDVVAADVLVNVTDLSHPQFYAQRANVQHVLEQLRLKQGQLNAMINVLNKSDKVSKPSLTSDADADVESEEGMDAHKDAMEGGLFVSATGGEGLRELQLKIQGEVLRATKQKSYEITVPAGGRELNWLHHSDATVGSVGAVETSSKEEEDSNKLVIHAILSEATLGKFMAKFGNSITVSESKDFA